MSKIKQMTQEEFLAKYTGVKNIIRRRVDVLNVKIGKFNFTPARKFLEVKLSHSIRFFKLYSATENTTYLFMVDDGFFCFDDRWYRDSKEIGYLVKIDGELENMDEFLDNHGKLLTKIYNEREHQILEDRRKDREQEQTA